MFKRRIRNFFCVWLAMIMTAGVHAQRTSMIDSFRFGSDILITIDKPRLQKAKHQILVLYALPNGNTTAQTMGKKIEGGEDWHFDIQHIKAQTDFIRHELKNESITIAYLENDYRSWPKWKTVHSDYAGIVQRITDTLMKLLPSGDRQLYLNGHSGGGRFIFSYLDGLDKIPAYVKRISFLDSNYGYDSTYLPKLRAWLLADSRAVLNVFAYNDSVALYNGKPVVSDTGGTWYRSHRMLRDLGKAFSISKLREDSIIVYSDPAQRIQFFLKTNPDRKIYHTQQVELNGFIHSILAGTKADSKRYKYYGKRAYTVAVKSASL
jgi:hypothetical protein